jgi:hypothetical protein
MSTVGTITQLTTTAIPMEWSSRAALPTIRYPDSDIFAGRAYELRDVAQWLDLNGQKDLGRQVRDLAAKVYEISIEKRNAEQKALAP